MKKRGKLIIHAAGGTAINIINKANEVFKSLPEEFSEIVINNIDTSVNNVMAFARYENKFFKIESGSFSKAEINGSGGEKMANIEDIKPGIKKYLDESKIDKKITGEFHVVVSSGSGGSGGTIAGVLINNLLEKDIPVVPILIGDDTDLLLTTNTYTTISVLDKIARNNNKPLSVVYYNNNEFPEKSQKERFRHVDNKVINFLISFAAISSGVNLDLDFQDIYSLINQGDIKTTKIPAGLYRLNMVTNDSRPELSEDSIITTSRTLIMTDSGSEFEYGTASNKKGHALRSVNETLKVDAIHFYNVSKSFTKIIENLKYKIDSGKAILNSIQTDEIEPLHDELDDLF